MERLITCGAVNFASTPERERERETKVFSFEMDRTVWLKDLFQKSKIKMTTCYVVFFFLFIVIATSAPPPQRSLEILDF